ncbi:ABC1 kinase family protein [Virgibacillus kekensis]|uniref:ABC1 kinase family protein n=1 Tax=Virgibacillus kekensis TaxID=202261 RepID=A0ABV9DH18_9BACI
MLGVGNTLKFNLFYRCFIFVWLAVKFISQIYLFHLRHRIWDQRTRIKWNSLLERQAKEYREKAVRLGGVLIKVGQFMSTRADFMPEVFIKELSGLVDKVPPMSFDYAKNLLEQEWGTELDTHLQSIETSSVASASIGEVYQAELHDGSSVAIKVQRYRVDDIFHMDFKALKLVFRVISLFTSFGKKADLNALYNELIQVMDKELDFEQELAYGAYFRDRYAENNSIHIPAYYERLCTKRVLVMEWIDGAKVTDFTYLNEHNISPELLAKRLFDFYLDQFMNHGYFHADPHAGNILVQQDGTISIIDFGMVSDVRKQDTLYFKKIIQGLIVNDYDTIIETMDEMNFILPNADRKKLKKMIRKTIEIYESGSFRNMDSQAMDQLKEDLRVFINEQPIQVSADYAYLGRAASIILGILVHLYPEIDIEKMAKPKIKQFFGGKNLTDSIYKEIVKDTAKPILSYPRAMLNWLENGEKDRQWEKEQQHTHLMHHFFLLLEGVNVLLIFAGFVAFAYFTFHSLPLIGGTILGIFLVSLALILRKHYKFIKLRK